MKKEKKKTSRERVVKPTTKSGHKLTPQQELFCQLYAGDREFFGNGVQSYIEAYGVDINKPGWYRTAKAGACENLTKPYILERIDEIFEAHGLNDQFVDKQLEKLIVQDADFSAKIKAIAEYNKLKARITEKRDITSGGEKISSVKIVVEDFSDKGGKNATRN
nr:MAG TPA: Terminase small subunit [Caudoviricetes sp.]